MNESGISIPLVLIVLLSGLFGMYYHWRTAKRKGRSLKTSFWRYLLSDNPMGSGSMFVAYLGSMSGLYALGTFDTLMLAEDKIEATLIYLQHWTLYMPVIKPILGAISAATLAGYVCDSRFNDVTRNEKNKEPADEH